MSRAPGYDCDTKPHAVDFVMRAKHRPHEPFVVICHYRENDGRACRVISLGRSRDGHLITDDILTDLEPGQPPAISYDEEIAWMDLPRMARMHVIHALFNVWPE